MITVLGAADLSECCDLAESRGWWREERKWRLLFDVGTVYGVRDAGRLVATAVLTRYGRTAAAASMVLVAADRERRGLGRRLTERALADAGGGAVFLNATGFGRPPRLTATAAATRSADAYGLAARPARAAHGGNRTVTTAA